MRTINPQVAVLEAILHVAQEKSRTEVCAAIQAEIEKLMVFDLDVQEPLKRGDRFDAFWKAYPKRKGSNPRAPAEKLFAAAVKRGADPNRIIAGADAYRRQDPQAVGTCYIAQAMTWLRQERWRDYTPDAPALPVDPKEAKRLEAIEDMKRFGL